VRERKGKYESGLGRIEKEKMGKRNGVEREWKGKGKEWGSGSNLKSWLSLCTIVN
jgi:hypothetical protein